MPAQMVDLLDTLCPSQNIYLIDGYCLQKVVPKVPKPKFQLQEWGWDSWRQLEGEC